MKLKKIFKKENLMKKAAAFLSAAAITVSAFSTSISAAAESLTYEWNSYTNPYTTIKKEATNSGVKGTHLRVGEQITRFKIGSTGDYAFCIEPGTGIGGVSVGGSDLMEDGYTEKETSDYMNELGTTFRWYLGLVQYYGYASHKNNGNYYVATQQLTWEMILGYRGHTDATFSRCSDVLYDDFVYPAGCDWCSYRGVETAYKDIVNSVTHHKDLPSNSYLTNLTKSEKNPAIMKYNTSTMRYEAKITVPSSYVDNNSLAHNFSDLKNALEKLVKSEFNGTYGTDYGIASSTSGSNTTYTIWSKERQFTQGVKTTEAIKLKLKSGITEQQRLFVKPGKQTCLISTQIDPVSAYVSIAAYNEPNFTISKTYTNSKGEQITGISLESLLNSTDFTVSTVINGKTYYVVADEFKTAEYNFSSYTEEQSKATKIKVTAQADGKAGKAVIYDLPTAQTGGRKYTVAESTVPGAKYAKQSKSVTLPSPTESNYSANPANPVVSFDNKESSADWGSVTLNKEIADISPEYANLSDIEKSQKISEAMSDVRFAVGYKDGNTVRYFKTAALAPYNAFSNRTDMGKLDGAASLSVYADGSGKYYLPAKVTGTVGNYKLVFDADQTTTSISEAYQFAPCCKYDSTTGQLDDNFGELFFNFAELENGNAKNLVFVEINHAYGYGYDADSMTNADPVDMGSNEFINSLSAGYSGVVTDGRYTYPYTVSSSDGKSGYGSLVNKTITFNLNLIKKGTDGEPVQGAEFALYSGHADSVDDTSKPIETAVSDENGNVEFKSLLTLNINGRRAAYSYKEISAPKGYVVDSTVSEFDYTDAGAVWKYTFSNAYLGEFTENAAVNGYHTLKLNLHKVDPVNNVPLKGIIFDVKDNSGKIVATLTTDADGNASVSDLPLGKLDTTTNKFAISYTVTEKSDDDYKMVDNEGNIIDTFTVNVSGDDIVDDMTKEIAYTATVNNYLATVDLKVVKIDDYGKPVKGATFDVRPTSDIVIKGNTLQKKGETVGTITTDENGYGSSTYVEYEEGSSQGYTKTITIYAGFEYELVETVTPEPYVKPDNSTKFKAEKETGTLVIPHEVNVENETQKGDIKVYKVDSENNKKYLAGAEFALTCKDTVTVNGVEYAAGKTIATLTTDENGYASVGDLPVNHEYILTETKAPAGYVAAGPTTVELSYDSELKYVSKEVDIKNKATEVHLSKKAITGDDELPGAKLQIRDGETVVEEWISTNEPHIIKGILTAGKKYTLHEEVAPDGYVIASDIEFTVNSDGTVNTVEMKDDTTKIEFYKLDDKGNNLPGAKLRIVDSEGNIVKEWISTAEAYRLEAELISGLEYTLQETEAPKGYVLSADVKFTVSKDGRIDKVEMVDRPTIVEFSKKSLTGAEEIPGAVLYVADETGEIIEKWTSTEKPHIVTALLEAGKKYILHEEVAPSGYVVANDVEFTVSTDGSVDVVTMYDDCTKVVISKKAITGDDELPGASLKILDGDTVIDSWVSTDKPHEILAKLVAGKTYVLHEEIAPAGYVVANDIEFTVSEDGTIDTVDMRDDTTKVEIAKYDADTGKILPGAVLQILDGEIVVEEWTSAEEPHMLEAKLIAGNEYILHEVSAPEHYLLSEDIPFTVSTDGRIDKIEMSDFEQRGNVEIHKITEEMKNVEGIKFILSGTSNFGYEVNREEETDENGIALFEHLPVGTYTVTEDGETVPTAYIIADEFDVTVKYNETTIKEVTNEEKTGSVQVHKTTEGNFNVEGITFILSGVSDSGREISLPETTDENGIALWENIPVGTYTITEDGSTVPYGYLVADSQEVTVMYAETVEAEFINNEMTGEITVHKTTEGQFNVEGITFILSGISDTGREIKIPETTDKDGVARFENIPVGTYTITEDGKTVPYGYLVAEPQTVKVMYAETVNADFLNEEMTGEVVVHKTTEGMRNVEGITFILSGTSDTGREIKIPKTTDKDGIARFENIPVGTYEIYEDGETVPYGYLVSEPKQVKVMYAETINPEFINKEQTGTVKIQKRTEGMTDISGIKFILKGTSDTGREINIEATTDEKGVATFTNVPIGTYEIYEDGSTVPYGYLIADSQGVTVSNAETSNLTFENKKIPEQPETPSVPNIPSTPNTGARVGGTLSIVTLSAAIVIMLSKKRKRED